MIDPNEPAYPFDKYTGLTIRQELAARFMAAELSATEASSTHNYEGFERDAWRSLARRLAEALRNYVPSSLHSQEEALAAFDQMEKGTSPTSAQPPSI